MLLNLVLVVHSKFHVCRQFQRLSQFDRLLQKFFLNFRTHYVCDEHILYQGLLFVFKTTFLGQFFAFPVEGFNSFASKLLCDVIKKTCRSKVIFRRQIKSSSTIFQNSADVNVSISICQFLPVPTNDCNFDKPLPFILSVHFLFALRAFRSISD